MDVVGIALGYAPHVCCVGTETIGHCHVESNPPARARHATPLRVRMMSIWMGVVGIAALGCVNPVPLPHVRVTNI